MPLLPEEASFTWLGLGLLTPSLCRRCCCCSTGLRALIYSGDHDLCVPHTGSEAWTAAIHRRTPQKEADSETDDYDSAEAAAAAGVIHAWQPWFNSESPKPQVAGYMVEYDSGMIYATVKGAGALEWLQLTLLGLRLYGFARCDRTLDP